MSLPTPLRTFDEPLGDHARIALRTVSASGGTALRYRVTLATESGTVHVADVTAVDAERLAIAVEPVFGPEVSLTLARVARHLAEAASTRPVDVDTTDPAMRHYLHRLGFVGPAGHLLEAGPDTTPVPMVTSTEELARSLNELLGAEQVRPEPMGRLRRVTTRWEHGTGDSHRLTLGLRDHGAFRVLLPARPDLMLDELAGATRTLLALFGRFPGVRPGVAFSFKYREIMSGHAHGLANVQEILLSPSLICADLVMRRVHDPGFHPPTGRPDLEMVITHEVWHAVEFHLIGRSHRQAARFRAEIGHLLGIDTLEHAFPGARADPTIAHRRAHDLLRSGVSAYAGASPMEATAELFTEYWLSPAPRPLASAFGEIVERYVPDPLG